MSSTTWNHRERERENKIDSRRKLASQNWKDHLFAIKKNIEMNRTTLVSAAMAYYAMFSLVPAFTSVVLIYAWVSDPNEIANHLSRFSDFVPETLLEILTTQLSSLASSASSSLGIGAIFSLLLSLFAASKISSAIIKAMNIIYVRDEDRGFIKLRGLAFALTFFGVLLSLVALGVIIGVPILTNLFDFPSLIESAIILGSWVALLGIFSLFLSITYYFGPNHRQENWKWISWGSVVAAVLWAISSLLFSWFAKDFGNFNKTYGSLAAIIVVMTWFYLTCFIILLGGEINAELAERNQKQFFSRGRTRPSSHKLSSW